MDSLGGILTGAGACHTVTHITTMDTGLTIIIITGPITIMAGTILIHITMAHTGMDTIMDIMIIITITPDIIVTFTMDTGIHVLRIPIIREVEVGLM